MYRRVTCFGCGIPSPVSSTALPPAQCTAITTSSASYQNTPSSAPMGYEFEFSARFASSGSSAPASMTSADELFLNSQIRPMKLSTHLERPQVLAPLLDLEGEEEDKEAEVVNLVRGRDLRLRNKSIRRRTRSMSPLRSNTPLEWAENEDHVHGDGV